MILDRLSPNLLMLNPSKTDFFLVGLPKQLSLLVHHDDVSSSPVAYALLHYIYLGIQFDSKLNCLYDDI